VKPRYIFGIISLITNLADIPRKSLGYQEWWFQRDFKRDSKRDYRRDFKRASKRHSERDSFLAARHRRWPAKVPK
jgi:hypothetical protein